MAPSCQCPSHTSQQYAIDLPENVIDVTARYLQERGDLFYRDITLVAHLDNPLGPIVQESLALAQCFNPDGYFVLNIRYMVHQHIKQRIIYQNSFAAGQVSAVIQNLISHDLDAPGCKVRARLELIELPPHYCHPILEQIVRIVHVRHQSENIGIYFLLMPYKEPQEFQGSSVLIHYLPILFWLLSSNSPAKTVK